MYINTEFIPASEREHRVCYRCGTTKSVKYRRVYDFGSLDFCNRCYLVESADDSVQKYRARQCGVFSNAGRLA